MTRPERSPGIQLAGGGASRPERMHADEILINEDIVRELLADQFPRWAGLPLGRVPSSGTVNAIFRLGDDLAVRAPFVPGDAGILREAEWSPRLAPHLPVRVPRVLGVGGPGAGYPSPWLVVDWIPGENCCRPPSRSRTTVTSIQAWRGSRGIRWASCSAIRTAAATLRNSRLPWVSH